MRLRTRHGVTIVELLALVAVVALVLAWLLPAVQGAREAARRAQCTGNLKQIALALYNYADTHKTFPPAYTVDARGRPLHSWRTLILPYLEQQALYNTIDLTRPWDDPANAAALALQPMTYRCPSADLKPGFTTYLGVASPTAAFHPTTPRSRDDFTDGTASTALVVEVDAARAVPWMAPQDADEALLVKLVRVPTDHPGGRNVAFADCAIWFVKTTARPAIWKALLTVAGGEDVGYGDL